MPFPFKKNIEEKKNLEKPQETEDVFEVGKEYPKEEIEKPLEEKERPQEKKEIPEIYQKPIEEIEKKPRTIIPPIISKKKKEEIPQIKTETQIVIEKILFSDLNEIIAKLDEGHKIIFQKRGEEIAWEISGLLPKVKTKIKRIFQLIREWLRLIPGVNKFFLEEEVKKKIKEILKISNQ